MLLLNLNHPDYKVFVELKLPALHKVVQLATRLAAVRPCRSVSAPDRMMARSIHIAIVGVNGDCLSANRKVESCWTAGHKYNAI